MQKIHEALDLSKGTQYMQHGNASAHALFHEMAERFAQIPHQPQQGRHQRPLRHAQAEIIPDALAMLNGQGRQQIALH